LSTHGTSGGQFWLNTSALWIPVCTKSCFQWSHSP
jgi:hypothetical protein